MTEYIDNTINRLSVIRPQQRESWLDFYTQKLKDIKVTVESAIEIANNYDKIETLSKTLVNVTPKKERDYNCRMISKRYTNSEDIPKLYDAFLHNVAKHAILKAYCKGPSIFQDIKDNAIKLFDTLVSKAESKLF
jgi:truncated hemoglobin YjbI